MRSLLALVLLVATPGVLLDGVWLRGETPYAVGALETTLPWNRIGDDDVRVVNPLTSDAILQFLPWDITLRREWRGVAPPAWNPYESTGAPLAANPQARTLDPIRLASLPWDARRAPGIRIWIALVIAGWSMYGLGRHLGAGIAASLLGGLAWQLGGYVVPWFEHPTGTVAAYLPAIVWAGAAWLRGGRARAFAGLAVLYALQFYAGHPETTLHLTTVAGLFWLVRGVRAGVRRWAGLAGGLVTGGLLAAPVLVPFLEYLVRSDALASRAGHALIPLNEPAAAATFLVPGLFGSPIDRTWSLDVDAITTLAYIGLVPWLLAPLAFVRGHRASAFGAVVVGLVCGAIAYGAPGAAWLMERLPGFSVAPNARLVLGVAFGGAVLGTLGLDALGRMRVAARWQRQSIRLGRWALVALLVLDLRIAWGDFHPTAPPSRVLPPTELTDTLFDHTPTGGRVLSIAPPGDVVVLPPNVSQAFGFGDVKHYDALGIPAVERAVLGALYSARAAGLASDFLGIFGAAWTALPVPPSRFATAAVVAPDAPHIVFFPDAPMPVAIDVLSATLANAPLDDGAIVGEVAVLDENERPHRFPLRLGIESGRADEPTSPRAAETIRGRKRGTVQRRAIYSARFAWDSTWGRPRAARVTANGHPLRIDGVGFVDATGRSTLQPGPDAREIDGVWIARHRSAWPRAFTLPSAPPATIDGARGLRPQVRAATIEHYGTDEVRMRVDARDGDWLVLTDTHYPGWQATLVRDGVESTVPIEPAFGIFRGVALGAPGPVTVRMTYRPWSVRIGWALALVGIAVLAFTGIRARSGGG